jgi:hypothetical protein
MRTGIHFSAIPGRVERTSRTFKVAAKSVVLAVVVALSVNYALDIRLRSMAHECERKNSDDGLYVAELCLLRDNGHDADYPGRVYDAKNNELLTDRENV